MKLDSKKDYRDRRHMRLRQKVRGTAERPRMCVFISNKHMYVQFVNDETATTLATVSTLSGDMKDAGKINVETAKKLGALAAKVATEKGLSEVVFDRGGFAFHGRIKALADAAREAGLKF
jgi:large subunit ribosomal protein L18